MSNEALTWAFNQKLIAEDAWRDFQTPRGEEVHHERFVDFLTTPPTRGVGCSVDMLRRLLQDDKEALISLDQVLQRPGGRPSETFDNIQDKAPTGTSESAALRRLRKDRPDLLEQVKAEELSAHAAMVIAGFRHRTVNVRTDSAERAAASIKRNCSPEFIAALVAELGGQDG